MPAEHTCNYEISRKILCHIVRHAQNRCLQCLCRCKRCQTGSIKHPATRAGCVPLEAPGIMAFCSGRCINLIICKQCTNGLVTSRQTRAKIEHSCSYAMLRQAAGQQQWRHALNSSGSGSSQLAVLVARRSIVTKARQKRQALLIRRLAMPADVKLTQAI